MITKRIATAAALLAILLMPAYGRSSSHSSKSNSKATSKATSKAHSKTYADSGGHPYGAKPKKAESHLVKYTSSVKCASCARDSHGRIERSSTAKHDFQRSNPCPSTGKRSGACPGYVIDHRQALKHGGADAPSNMQWQTTAEAKAKDRVE